MSTYHLEAFGGEQLTPNGVPMRCPAWVLLDLENLWLPQYVWDNRTAPGVDGTFAFAAAEDELRTTLPFWILGTHDWDGYPYEDSRVGFRRNWLYLLDNVFTGEVVATEYQSGDPDEPPTTFGMQFSAPTFSERYPSDWKGTVAVILPSGAIRGAGS